MSNWRTDTPTPSRLEEGREVYTLVLDIADRLDGAALDLWAGGLRSCLDATSTLFRQQHLVLELVRIRDSGIARQAGVGPLVDQALSRLALGLGATDIPYQPLYSATRSLADHLELNGGRRWLTRLRTVIADPDRNAAARVQRIASVMGRMTPGTVDLPERSGPLVRAVDERLARHGDVTVVARCLGFALAPPTPSRVRVDGHEQRPSNRLHDATPQVAERSSTRL